MSSTLPLTAFDNESSSTEFDLIALLLAEQQSLTAVERFSVVHEQLQYDQPAQAHFYRDLLPATSPAPGQQYAFQVDLDSCSGCKSCVVACHSLNGLDDDESWRRVGTVTIGRGSTSRVQHVTTACHHCEDPGCLSGCPVKAYVKDDLTGIVRHLDDQCIGCKYCTMMCPYEVPRYNNRLGIVRKCDMCHQRLAVGEAPACVQACPNEAISIALVPTGSTLLQGQQLASGAPDSSITCPSTQYLNTHADAFQSATPQDAGIDAVAEDHWPLAVMLVATQVSVGMLVIERLAATLLWTIGTSIPLEATRSNALAALVIGGVGLNIASLHLGQPLRAWRVFLGLRTSWLSREAVVLGKYVGLLTAAVVLFWLPALSHYLPAVVAESIPSWAGKAALGTAVLLGIAGLFSSGMIYIATKRQLWRFQRTMTRFYGTAIVGGLAFSSIALIYAAAGNTLVVLTLLTTLSCLLAKLYWEWKTQLGPQQPNDDDYDRRTRMLVDNKLPNLRTDRLLCGVAAVLLIGIGAMAIALSAPVLAMIVIGLGAGMLFAGELCERLIYFSSIVYDRMPGTLR
jgi:formate dehydrogenase iron-sulfur subunit